jgi:peptidoglycan/xylan/chitin deacetylase (PgdA/CDA1 family)
MVFENIDRRAFLTLAAVGLPLFGQSTEPAYAAKSSAAGRVLFELPRSHERRVAWTIDDGYSNQTVAGYLDKLQRNPDLKVTFFVTSAAPPWKHHARTIRRLIQDGQVQVANHTHTHTALTKISSHKIANELSTCRKFLEDNFGVSGAPFYRPPYGYYDDRVRNIAAELGYTDTVMWFGTLADSGKTTQRGIYRDAEKWMKNGRIVIAHANYPTVLGEFDSILKLLKARSLKTVTLSEAFA